MTTAELYLTPSFVVDDVAFEPTYSQALYRQQLGATSQHKPSSTICSLYPSSQYAIRPSPTPT